MSNNKTCKVQLDRLFDYPQVGSSGNNLPGHENLTAVKSCRMTRIPSKLSNFDCGKKDLSGHCPGCRTYVNHGEKGVVCEKCKAYWHYACAKVTQEEIDTIWKKEFVCETHRLADKNLTFKMPHSTAQPSFKNGNPILTSIKINSYAIDNAELIQFKLNNLESKLLTEEKSCQRQHSIKTNSVTYQILVENFISFGDQLGVKPKRHDVDNKGDSTQDQYELSLGNSIPVSVTYYHTTNHVFVQLKSDKELKGARKAAKTAERIQQLRDFVNNHLTILINNIESDARYVVLKQEMDSSLRDMLHEFQQSASDGESSYSPRKAIEANSSNGNAETPPNISNKSPRKRSGKRCNDECEKARVKLNQRVSTLEKERNSLQQKYETSEKHQEALRSTISSKESLIGTQNQLINDHVRTINSQKQLISEMEMKSATHSELATSFLDILVTEGAESGNKTEEINETIYQQLHNKIKDLQNELTSRAEKIGEIETEREKFEVLVADYKEKLGTKTKEYSGLKTQLATVEQSVLSRENELKNLQTKLADNEARCESLLVDNTKIGLLLTEAERRVAKLEEEAKVSVNTTNPLVEQLTDQVKQKEFEITQLKESVEFLESASNQAKNNWKEENKAAKKLQNLLNEEKMRRVQIEEECSSLQVQLGEEKIKMERNKALFNLSKTAAVEKYDDEEVASRLGYPQDMNGAGVQEVNLRGNAQDTSQGTSPCIFEMKGYGACMRKEKCKYDHNLASSLRNDPEAVSRILVETSVRIGKCAFEMTQKGSCPGEPTCNAHHNQSHLISEKKSTPRRICYRELMKQGTCPRGEGKCRFSHKISDEERSSEEFVESQRKEKDDKASKCLNEFRREGFCRRKDQCPFSHKISKDDRNSEVLKKSMAEREVMIKKRNGDSSIENTTGPIENPVEFMKEMMTLKSEFLEFMKKMKASSSP